MGFNQSESQARYEMEMRELADWGGHEGDPWSVRQTVDALFRRGEGLKDIDRLYMLLGCVTGGTFTSSFNMVRGFHQVKEFFRVVRGCYEDRLEGLWTWDGPEGSSPWNDPKEVERFMSEVLDVCKRSRVWYHPGWLLCLTKVRKMLRPRANPPELTHENSGAFARKIPPANQRSGPVMLGGKIRVYITW